MKERAVFYARVSTADEGQLNSIEIQIEENRKAIKSKGWELVGEYIDRGKSGTQVKRRDEYQRLYNDMERDDFDIIVIKDQDRLMRNTKDWYLFVNQLALTGKRLYMYLENKFYSPDSALITGIKAIMAEDFSRSLSRKLVNFNNGRYEKAKAGETVLYQGIGKAYGWDQKDGVITLNPEQSKIRRLMCELTLQGKGSTEVAKIVNDAGYRNTVGNKWKITDIPRMVYNHLNVGTVILNQKKYDFEAKRNIYTDPSEWIYVENAIPAIVSKEEWERLQKIREKRTTVDRKRGKKAGKSNLFSGKLVCGCCGATYWRKTNRNTHQEFWVCSTKQTKGRKTRAHDAVGGRKGEINPEGCDNTNISTEALLEMLEAATETMSANTDTIKADIVKWLEGLKKSIIGANSTYTKADLEKEKRRRDKLLDSFLDGIISEDAYKRKVENIESKIDEINKELRAYEGKREDIEEIDRVLENIDEEIVRYLDEQSKLKIDYLLDRMERVVIYENEVKIQVPSFSREIVVKKIQYVSNGYADLEQYDRALHADAVSAV